MEQSIQSNNAKVNMEVPYLPFEYNHTIGHVKEPYEVVQLNKKPINFGYHTNLNNHLLFCKRIKNV